VVAVIAVAGWLTLGELKAQAQETDAIDVETEFYEVPISIDLFNHIQGLCADYVIPVEVVLAMIEVESTYKADAVSKVGAVGLMQVIPEYHEDRMNRLNCTDLFDPYQNVTVGMDFLSDLIDEYDGNLHKALTAYNYGQKGANDKFFGQGTYQSEYSLKVLETTEKIEEGMTEMFFTDDPVKDYDRYQEEQDKQLQKLPKCSYCDEHIQDEHFYEINDEVICEECLNQNFRKRTDDYVE
jgi:hypothetical protein